MPELSSISARSVRRPSSGRSVLRPSLSLNARGPPHLDLDAELAQVFLVLRGQIEILRVARRDDDLAVLVVPLRVVDDRKAADAQAGRQHRHRARFGDIQVHGAPPSCFAVTPCQLQLPEILENQGPCRHSLMAARWQSACGMRRIAHLQGCAGGVSRSCRARIRGRGGLAPFRPRLKLRRTQALPPSPVARPPSPATVPASARAPCRARPGCAPA